MAWHGKLYLATPLTLIGIGHTYSAVAKDALGTHYVVVSHYLSSFTFINFSCYENLDK